MISSCHYQYTIFFVERTFYVINLGQAEAIIFKLSYSLSNLCFNVCLKRELISKPAILR